MLSFRQMLVTRIFAISVALAPLAALGQQYQELPPNSVIGNVSNGPTAPGSAVPLDELAASLMREGQLVKGPATATAGHAAIFGASSTVIEDGGGQAGTGTVTQVNCGSGLSGGSFSTAGTCALNTVTPGAWVGSITPQGRLTLASATPVMTSSVPGATNVIYTPYNGNLVPLYDGTNMVPTAFAEISVSTTDTTKSPAAIGASKVNDWFVWNDSGTIRIGHGPDWTNDTTRSAGTALVRVNGILLNNASITNGPAASRGTYVGTTRSNSSSQLDWIFGAAAGGGTAGWFGVWNAYNRVTVSATVEDTSSNWSATAGTIAPLDNFGTGLGLNNRVSYIIGLAEDPLVANATGGGSSASGGIFGVAIGHDSTSAITGLTSYSGSATIAGGVTASATVTGDLGFHFIQELQFATVGTATIFGSSGATNLHTGLSVSGRF